MAPSSSTRSGWLARLTERQMAIAVIAFGLLLYLPLAGSYGLWDPWETHYSEVARQMTKRSDFISLWWPGSPRDADVFWSKPVLTFWLMSLGMHVARVGLPGGPAGEMALTHRAEWAVRVPMVLMGALALWGVYLLVARFVSRRAGVLSVVVLATSPMFFLIARQAMTDIPFVGPMTMALALGALALFDDEDETLPRRRWRRLSWPHHPAFYAAVGVFLLLVVPQLVVDSVQLKVVLPWGTRHRVMYGAVAMIPYYLASLLVLWLGTRARYKAPLYLGIAAMLCGVAVLAKGFAGLGLPVIVFLAYLSLTWNWRRLRRAQLLPGIVVAFVACVVVAAPWHHAMIIRHGWAFWNELFGDNHWRRMVLGRHGDRGTFEYFLRELGYAVLPWIAVAPAALVALAFGRRARDVADARAEARRQGVVFFGAVWFAAAYVVVSLSMTKFHHYILPALPGLAIVVGCFLDELLERRDGRLGFLVALVGLPLLALVAQDLLNAKNASQRFLWLFSYDYVHSPHGRPWPESLDFRGALTWLVCACGLATAALAIRRARQGALAALAGAAIVLTIYVLDVYMPAVAPYWTQKGPIASYYKARRSPAEPLVAYQMYWRGETFYTQNAIYEGPMEDRTVFDMEQADEKLTEWIGRHRGRRVFFMFERGRQGRLVGLLPAEARSSFHVLDETNNKFSVGYADI